MRWTAHAAILVAALAAMPSPLAGHTGAGATGDATQPTQARQIPANAIAVGNHWVCNDGYRRGGETCHKIDIPANAHAIGAVWVCDDGYLKAGGECAEIDVPENALSILGGWVCDHGYRRDCQECVKVDVPGNAFAVGSAWYCDLGFERQDDQCLSLPEDERQAQLERLLATAPSDTTMSPEALWMLWVVGGVGRIVEWTWPADTRVGRYDFYLNDVSGCSAYKVSEEYAAVECPVTWSSQPEQVKRSDDLQNVARSCLVHLSGPTEGELVCADRWLALVQARCRAIMTADGSGILTCR